jgi:hypothetical protein
MGWLLGPLYTAVLCLLLLRCSYSLGAGGTAARDCLYYYTLTYQKLFVWLGETPIRW